MLANGCITSGQVSSQPTLGKANLAHALATKSYSALLPRVTGGIPSEVVMHSIDRISLIMIA